MLQPDFEAAVGAGHGRVEAKPDYLDALAGWQRVLGEKHPRTLETMSEMADLYRRQGRDGEARKLDDRLDEIRGRPGQR